jgi:hypothetical protein
MNNLTNKLCVGWSPNRCKILIEGDCRGCSFFRTPKEVAEQREKTREILEEKGLMSKYKQMYGPLFLYNVSKRK